MERHRIIYKALEDLIPKRIHAISIKAELPED
jgi:stress-induced morphogen